MDGPLVIGKFIVKKLDLEIVKDAIDARLQLQNGETKYFLSNSSIVRSVTPEARKHLSSARAYQDLYATAIVVNSPISAVLGNFYLRFGNFTIPTRLFKSEDAGKSWLLSL